MIEAPCGPLGWAAVGDDEGLRAGVLALGWALEAHRRWRPNPAAIRGLEEHLEMLTCGDDRLPWVRKAGAPFDDYFLMRKPTDRSTERLWATWDLRTEAKNVSNHPLWVRKGLVDPLMSHDSVLPTIARSLHRAAGIAGRLLPERDTCAEVCALAGVDLSGPVAAMACALDDSWQGTLDELLASARAVLE